MKQRNFHQLAIIRGEARGVTRSIPSKSDTGEHPNTKRGDLWIIVNKEQGSYSRKRCL